MTKRLPHISVLTPLLLPALIVLCLLVSGAAVAEESVSTEEWDITADKITRYDKPMSIVAEGNIVLVKRRKLPPKPAVVEEGVTSWSDLLGEPPEPVEITPEDIPEEVEEVYETQITIKADWATYDIALNTIKARGNVSVTTEDEQLLAEQAVVNLEQETGTFKNATIIRDEYDMHLEGEVIEKTGYKTYHIENGWVITCKVKDGETPPWSFAASDAVIEQDGYATLRNAKFKVKNTPVFYSPWLMLPVKNKRQTGFLFPEIGSSQNNGFSFNLPFFWNISNSTDMTIYTEYMINRGYMPGLEFRYVKKAEDKGLAMANYLSDDLSDPSETEYYADTGFTHTNKDRYWIRAKADQDFAGGWTSRLDLDIVSDRDYLTEFNNGMSGFTSSNERFLDSFGRSLENKTDDQRSNSLGILKSWGPMSLTADLLAINDVRANKVGPSPLWTLPAVDFNGALPLGGFGNFTLDWDTDYVYFWREEGTGGHRVDLYPRLSAPIPLGPYLESRAEVGLRDTYYSVQEFGDTQWTNDSSQNRLLYDINAEIGTTLVRNYPLSGGDTDSFYHQVRPYVEYGFLPDEDQEDLPYFSSVDRIDQQNAITYGIDNFFDLQKDNEIDREYGYFKIKQSYSFLDEDSDEPFSAVNIKLGWLPLRSTNISYKTDIDVYDDGFVRHNLEATYYSGRGDRFGIEYVFDDIDNTEQINAFAKAGLFNNWRADFRIEHSISEDETNEMDLSLIYQALCWSVEFSTEYTPADTSFFVIF
ncbi:MAG: LPS assembly protein LptD, partial [Desulfocapsaceae bacterium]|nr:LPS assembly protein LptD [Desulfocapsaceae bacterium]